MIKPILFNTEMVRAIQNGTKTATRRVVKPQPAKWQMADRLEIGNKFIFSSACEAKEYNPPYHPGDILYVREAFCVDFLSNIPGTGRVHYKADNTYSDFTFAPKRYEVMRRAQFKPGWRPNENMPREAARIFLRVTDVKVQRVQDITEEEARREGCKDREDFHRVWNDCYAKPRPVKIKGVIDHYENYPWEDIQETRTYRGKPWHVIGNPWTGVVGFERCERTEGVLV